MQSNPRTRLFLALALVALALAWRLPWAATLKRYHVDETVTSLPTIAEIQAGERPIYVHGATYMAPMQEWCSAGLFVLGGPSRLGLRLPGAVFGSIAAGVTFLALCSAMPWRWALVISVCVACTNSVMSTYSIFSVPTWGGGSI